MTIEISLHKLCRANDTKKRTTLNARLIEAQNASYMQHDTKLISFPFILEYIRVLCVPRYFIHQALTNHLPRP